MTFDRQRYDREVNAMYVDLIAAADDAGGARCVDSPDLMFPEDHDDPMAKAVTEIAAKAICNRCPVMQMCHDFAVTTSQQFGVWGGRTAEERFSA